MSDTATVEATEQAQEQAPIIFTTNAAGKVSEMLVEEGDANLKLRVYVTGGGCSGFQYSFAFDDQVAEDDLALEKEGFTLLVDAMSFQYLVGATIDYQEGLEGSRFVITNPNATATCGCGSSFSV
jgi:iron-sulfur cluster insertion protein